MRVSAIALQSPRFWIVFLIVSCGAAIAAIKLMFIVFPNLHVDVSISREDAVARALIFQQERFPELQYERTAVAFIGNDDLQNYVELEAGDAAAFQELIPKPDAKTHFWRVRIFKPGLQQELFVDLSPTGIPLGYVYVIPEQEPGAAPTEQAARAIAENGARGLLGARFSSYSPLEAHVTRQDSGRVDHSFVYEHSDLVIGDARFRLEIEVAGDQLIAVSSQTFIPEAFEQRYGKMRALNNHISNISQIAMGLLLVLTGMIGGGIWLFRRQELQLRQAVAPGIAIGVGMACALLANLPMAWMNYQTTSTAQTFLMLQWGQAGLLILIVSIELIMALAIAEGLTRLAFGQHPRLWTQFRHEVAATPEIWGRVLGGYAWAGLFLLYVVLFYLFSTMVLGWWQPAGIESNPNILASWRPALAPIFGALRAGIEEECLFRAIPLAGAALIGNHFGKRDRFIIAALIVQALVFAGAHANYATLPGYSRLVEILIPALVFGLVYLRFGLLAGIIAHFEYDLTLMSLPIFSAEFSSLWIDRLLVILAGSAPLIAIILARMRQGALIPLGAKWRNSGYVKAAPVAVRQQERYVHNTTTLGVNIKTMLALGILFAILNAIDVSRPAQIVWPEFTIDRAQAQARAEEALAARDVLLNAEWRRTVIAKSERMAAAQFVWRESGPGYVQILLGRYIEPPLWVVTWRKFEGPVEDRSESWQVLLNPDGSPREIKHKLPEGRAGARLNREQALAIAEAWIGDLGWQEVAQLELKKIEETQRPARSDWTLQFMDKTAYHQAEATALIAIDLAGDEVAGYSRTISIPEAWVRAEREASARRLPFIIVSVVALLTIFCCAGITFFRGGSGRKFSLKIAAPWMLAAVIPFLAVTLMRMDTRLGVLQTTMGWGAQIGMLMAGFLVSAIALGGLFFLAAQAIHGESPRPGASAGKDMWIGSACALALGNYVGLLEMVLPVSSVPVALTADLGAWSPLWALLMNGLTRLTAISLSVLFAIGLVRFTDRTWRKSLIMALLILLLVCGVFADREPLEGLLRPTVQIFTILLIFELVRRRQVGAALAMLGINIALRQLYLFRALYPEAWWHSLIGAAAVLAATYLLVRHWHANANAPAREAV